MAPAAPPDPDRAREGAPEDAAPGGPRPDAPAGGGTPGGGGEGWGSRKALEVLALGFVFPVTVYVGFAVGRWIGERLGDAGTGGVVGLVVGALAGFWELYEYVRRLAPR